MSRQMRDQMLSLAAEMASIADDYLDRYTDPSQPLLPQQPGEAAPELRWARCCVKIARELIERAREVEG